MLVHICCSVDSHYFLTRLKEEGVENLTGYFYNPNIHPESEYQLRLLDVQRSCRMLGIPLIEEDYAPETWIRGSFGLEMEPEKGKRCRYCFAMRMEAAAKKCADLGMGCFTTTLLTSPKKELDALIKSGHTAGAKEGVEFFGFDFRKESGTARQFALAREDALYKQNYCGCLYALRAQTKDPKELHTPINRQYAPHSLEQKKGAYAKKQESRTIIRSTELSYALTSARLKEGKTPIPAHILPLSILSVRTLKDRVEEQEPGVYMFGKLEAYLLTLERYNALRKAIGQEEFDCMERLLAQAPGFAADITLRQKLLASPYNLSPVAVVQKIAPDTPYTLEIDAALINAPVHRVI